MAIQNFIKLCPWKYQDNSWNVIVHWAPLRKIKNYLKQPKDRDASLYIVIRRDKNKLLYIGMTHTRYSIDRIKNHGYRSCFISTGVMTVRWGMVTQQRVKDTESLLIFVCQPQKNTSKKKWIRPKEDTLVENRGLQRYLPKYLYYGTATNGLKKLGNRGCDT